MNYRFQNIYHRDKEGKISGAMSPVLFAKEMAEKLGFIPHGLVRIWFSDEEIHNWYEGPGKRQGLTGCDTLLICQINKQNQYQLMLMVNEGSEGCPVALHFSDEQMLPTLTGVYNKRQYEKKLTAEEIGEIIKAALEQNAFEFDKLYPQQTETSLT